MPFNKKKTRQRKEYLLYPVGIPVQTERVQTMNGEVYISFGGNALRKNMNPSVFPQP